MIDKIAELRKAFDSFRIKPLYALDNFIISPNGGEKIPALRVQLVSTFLLTLTFFSSSTGTGV